MDENTDYKSNFYIIDHSKRLSSDSKIVQLIKKQLDLSDSTPINRYELQNYTYYGINDETLRPKLWKIFLFYYPENKFKSETFTKIYRESYEEYRELAYNRKKSDPSIDELINEDIKRTAVYPMISLDRNCEFLDREILYKEKLISHREIIKEILLVFKVLNPAIEYVQGMNVIITILYYVFSKEPDTDFISTTFFCFLNLISEIRDFFVERMDCKSAGISLKLVNVLEIVKSSDPELYKNMKSKGLTEEIFHFRWVFLSFAQEFMIDDVVWLWDKILSDSTRFELVAYCAAAKILLLRANIIGSGYSECLEMLQSNTDIDVHSMFYKADEIRRNVYCDYPI